MITERDHELGRAIRDLGLPAESPDFWSRVRADLEAPAASPVQATQPGEAADVINLSDTRPPESGQNRSRVVWLAAAAALIAVAAFGVSRLRSTATTTIDPAGDSTPSSSSAGNETDQPDPGRPDRDLLDQFEAELRSLTYPSIWSDTGEITLVDGEWTSPPGDGEGSAQTHVTMWDATSTSSGPGGMSISTSPDGSQTAASSVILVADPGGSGTFYDFYLVVPADRGLYEPGDRLEVIGPIPIGDRVDIKLVQASSSGVTLRFVDSQGASRNRTYEFDGENFVRVNLPTWLGDPIADTDLACWSVINRDLLDRYAPVEPTDGRLIACDERDLDALLAERPDASLLDEIDALVVAKISG